MPRVVQHVPAAADDDLRSDEAEQDLVAALLARSVGDGLGIFNDDGLVHAAVVDFDRITFSHKFLLLFACQAVGAAKPPPRARMSWTSRVKARVSSAETWRR